MGISLGQGSIAGSPCGPLLSVRRDGVVEQLAITYSAAVPGEELVRRGDLVTAAQVLATFPRRQDHQVIDVAWELGLPAAEVNQAMKKTVGDTVLRDEVIAAKSGPLSLFHKSCLSPVTGVLSKIVDGWVVIDLEQTEDRPEMKAMLPGCIISADDEASVAVQTNAMVFDVAQTWGGEVAGPLRIIDEAEGQTLETADSWVSGRDSILITGGIVSRDSIRKAAEMGVTAIVTGRIDAGLLDDMDQSNLPTLVALDGYGNAPLSIEAFTLLQSLDGVIAAITRQTGAGVTDRAILAVSLDGSDDMSKPVEGNGLDEIDWAQVVRPRDYVCAVRGSFAGARGIVESIPLQPGTTSSGYELDGAFLRCTLDESGNADGDDGMWVPWLNLERIARARESREASIQDAAFGRS